MDKKLIYLLAGFFLFLFIWQKFVLDKYVPKPVPSKTVATSPAPSNPVTQKATAPLVAPAPTVGQVKIQKVQVDTSLYHAEFSNQGAVLTSFRLKKYTDDNTKPLEMIPQIGQEKIFPLNLDFEDPKISSIANQGIYAVDGKDLSLGNGEKGTLHFQFSDGPYTFIKSFQFTGNSYLIDSTIQAANGGSTIPVRVSWVPGLEALTGYKNPVDIRPSRGLVNTGDKVKHWDAKDAKEFKKIGSTVRWAGVEDNYFAGIFIPQNLAADAYMYQPATTDQKTVHDVNVLLATQRAEPLHMQIFIGPKDYVLLKDLGMDLENAVDFGIFGPIAKALFFTLRKLYTFTSNWGWAIVLLTVLIKIIFTPFTQKSFNSMKKMQVMQPELKKVQDKYAKMKNDDPRKQNMNTEVMALHKRYGVNPLGGCLPMLLQMPVLIAFYKLLSNAIELRKAPFAFWLLDLSRPDPYHITPLIMGATMLLQQRMTPTTDPMQKNMMYIMPVMFTVMSLKLQSGLVLYWLLSNVLAIAHQYYFQRQQKIVAVKEVHA